MIRILVLLFLLIASPAGAQTVVNIAADPTVYSIGFARAHRKSDGKIILTQGGTNPIGGDNSVRLYDPVANTFSIAWPNDYTNGGPQLRDNHMSFYVPARNELWIGDGSHLEQPGGFVPLRSGRFSFATNTWVATSTTAGGAFAGVIANFTSCLIDPAIAWSTTLNYGMCFGGSDGGNGSNRYWLIEPVTATTYTMSESLVQPRPPARAQASNLMVAAGDDLYLVGGFQNQIDGQNVFIRDLWRFNGVAKTWTELSKPPAVSYQPVLTYDSDKRLLLYWADSKLYIYHIDYDQWEDATPSGFPCVGNHVGYYSPEKKRHVYWGGNSCPSGNSANAHYGIDVPWAMTLPSRMWVSRPLPPLQLETRLETIGQTGYGPGGINTGQKHQRMVYNPGNQRFYLFSGDYQGGVGEGGFRTSMFSYDLQGNDTGNGALWKLEWPDCGLTGEISPIHTDETAFAFDATRSKMWLVGGFSSVATDKRSFCAAAPYNITGIYYGSTNAQAGVNNGLGDAQFPGTHVMTFNPVTNRWTATGFANISGSIKHAVYNPTTDEIISFSSAGGIQGANHMNPTVGGWTNFGMVCATGELTSPDGSNNCAPGTHYIADHLLEHEQPVLDVANQQIYIIDAFHKVDADPNKRFRMFRYDIATHGTRDMGWIPLPNADLGASPGFCNLANPLDDVGCTSFPYYTQPRDSTMLGYDSINKKVIWPAASNTGRFINMIYSPALNANGTLNLTGTGVWTAPPMDRSLPAEAVIGTNGMFIPELNVLVAYGGFPGTTSLTPPPSHSYFWLYRYGGPATLNPTATLTINSMNLPSGVAITVTPNDNSGQGNGTTSFQRTFTIANATPVTLTAPATAGTGPSPFSDWTGCDSRSTTNVTNDTCHVVMSSPKTVTAVYVTALITRTLTVTSTPVGLPLTILPVDNTGAGDCPITPCTRVYNNGANVQVTAPLTAGAASYTVWAGNCGSLTGNVCNVTMSANKTVTAPYVSGTSYRNSVDFSNVQGQRGWSYRDSVTTMTYGNGQWSGTEVPSGIGAGGLSHPGPTRSSVLRWTSTITGPIKITGIVRDADVGGGDGVNVSITQSGSTTATLLPVTTIQNGNTVGTDFDISATATIGDTFDFIVAARGDSNYDTTSWGDFLIAPPAAIPAVTSVKFGPGATFGAGTIFGR